MTARIIAVEPFDLVLFGASGDLARNKVFPALYRRQKAGQIPPGARILALARSQIDQDSFRAMVKTKALGENLAPQEIDEIVLHDFLGRIDYFCLAIGEQKADWKQIKNWLEDSSTNAIRAFYLATQSSLVAPICAALQVFHLVTPQARIVVEKPFGHNLPTAQILDDALLSVFAENCIYRIDHYLGKETVQNLMALRFANALFEPLWNSRYIDHVQITVAEDGGIAQRGAYYDQAGALRDMVQNHLLQLLCLIAMEAPVAFAAGAIRDAKVKLLQSLSPIHAANSRQKTIRGQYRACGQTQSYRQDAQRGASTTESFVALRVDIDNWRWAGVPFYLRTGKRLRARLSEIALIFKKIPHSIFPPAMGAIAQNALIIRLQPDEGVDLSVTIKEPGPGGMRLCPAALDMTFAGAFPMEGLRIPDAYERLILDVIRGNQTLFMRKDEVEAAWRWIDPICDAWQETMQPLYFYDPSSDGPQEAMRLIHQDGRQWREIL